MTDPTFSTTPGGDRIRDRLAIFSNLTDYNRSRDVLICTVDWQDRIVAVAESLTLRSGNFEGEMIPPTISGPASIEFLQAALDAAWAAGMRPKNWRLETTEQVTAMNNHLQDMRALVFAKPVVLIDPLKQGNVSNVG